MSVYLGMQNSRAGIDEIILRVGSTNPRDVPTYSNAFKARSQITLFDIEFHKRFSYLREEVLDAEPRARRAGSGAGAG